MDQKDLETEGKTGTGYLDVADLYKISGNFVIIENAVGQDIRLASTMAKLPQDKAPPKLETKNKEEDCKTNLKAKLKKNAQEKKLQQQQQRVSKYKIPSTTQLSYPNLDLESPKVYIPSSNQKHINPHEISLHFENDSAKLDDLKITSQNRVSFSEIKSIEKQYPRPKIAKPVDYRAPAKNSSFYY